MSYFPVVFVLQELPDTEHEEWAEKNDTKRIQLDVSQDMEKELEHLIEAFQAMSR